MAGEVPIEDCIAPIHDREGRTAGAVIVFRDVTRRLEAQRETAESRRIYEDLFDNSDAAIVDRDFSALFRAVQDLKRDGVVDLRAYLTVAEERLVGFHRPREHERRQCGRLADVRRGVASRNTKAKDGHP